MIEESKYSSDVMKKHLTKELAMTIKDNENFYHSTNVGSGAMIILKMMLK